MSGDLPERALSGNETSIIAGSFYFHNVPARIYSMKNLSSCLYRVRNACPRFIPESVFCTQSVVRSP